MEKIEELKNSRHCCSFEIPIFNGWRMIEIRRNILNNNFIVIRDAEIDVFKQEEIPEKLAKILLDIFTAFGVRKPQIVWPEDMDIEFQRRLKECDRDVLLSLKDDLDAEKDDASLGGLFG